MIFDSHSHTIFSSDSDMNAQEAAIKAASIGIGLVFTEHYDYDYCFSKNFKDMDFRFDPEEYWKSYEHMRGADLRLGAEVGLTMASIAPNTEFIAKVPFDMIIGSIHCVDGYDLYYPSFYEGKDKKTAYESYLAIMAEMAVLNPYIDVLGHIDYICRYAPYDNKSLLYNEYRESIDRVLEAVLATDTVMELNTRRLNNRQTAIELMPIYKKYHDLGGRYITLGSDAHNINAIGINFGIARDFADSIGLKIVTFCQREIELIKY